jgi:putative addiction module component (TIGR02574 family)
MSVALDKIRHDAYGLASEEKTELIEFLLLSIHSKPSVDIEAAWEKELAARQKALDEGRSQLIPWHEVKAKYDHYFEQNRYS